MPATQHNLSFKARAFATLLLAAVLTGCASSPTTGSGPPSISRAEQLLRQNNPGAAAQMYEQLAQSNPPPERHDFTLAAARAWLAANRPDDAQRIIDIPASGLTPAQQFESGLLHAEVALARGQYAPAWSQVSKIAEPRAATDAARLFQLQQQAALRAGQPADAVRAGIARDRVAASDAERTRVRRDLLTDLRSAIDRGLGVDPATSRDATVRGWLEIGQIAATAGRSPMSAPAAIERWRSRYPDHPAATIAVSEIIAPAERAAPRSNAASTTSIALLLPLTGAPSVAVPAALIRDGFLAAVARLPEGSRPVVKLHDTSAETVAVAMQNARREGATVLVGPLTRDEVSAAAEQRPGDIPVLLLNNLPGGGFAGANIYQYALAPEDEARQIARQMVGAGQRNALVLAPTGDWGTRVATAFADEMTRAGGRVVAQGNYDLGRNDLTPTITAVLGINDSIKRHQRVQQITGGSFGFDARPRPDIDAIFAAGWQPLALRQINPQVRNFTFADGEIPIYITQDGIDADAQANRDLGGMYVLDMPWTLDTTGPTADLRAATESIWTARGLRASRYFAFGFDAATLAMTLRNGGSTLPLSGLTGRLNLTPEGRVERNLNWARVSSDGSIQPADPAAR